MMKRMSLGIVLFMSVYAIGQFPPAAGEDGSTAISNESPLFVGWANEVVSIERGPQDNTDDMSPLASFGEATEATGFAEGNSTNVISLGNGGSITLSFPFPIVNGESWDFAVFENSFSDTYLELAHVEVSSDGERFVRIPSTSLTPTEEQLGDFGNIDPTHLNNLAGKYAQGFGTPFDLQDIADSLDIDLNAITHVRIIDVAGSINPTYGSHDSEGNMINDPFPTAFESCGFDLDGVGIINGNNPLNVDQYAFDANVTIYPNPSSDKFFIAGAGQFESMAIYSMQGKLMYASQFINTVDFEGLKLTSGLYLIRLFSENGNEVVKTVSFRP